MKSIKLKDTTSVEREELFQFAKTIVCIEYGYQTAYKSIFENYIYGIHELSEIKNYIIENMKENSNKLPFLNNKLGIADKKKLLKAIRLLLTVNIMMLANENIDYTYENILKLHYNFFNDIFKDAGILRNIHMRKHLKYLNKGVDFLYYKDIEMYMEDLIIKINDLQLSLIIDKNIKDKSLSWEGSSLNSKANLLTELVCFICYIQPFNYGNMIYSMFIILHFSKKNDINISYEYLMDIYEHTKLNDKNPSLKEMIILSALDIDNVNKDIGIFSSILYQSMIQARYNEQNMETNKKESIITQLKNANEEIGKSNFEIYDEDEDYEIYEEN